MSADQHMRNLLRSRVCKTKLPSIMAPRFAHFQERSTTLRIDRPGGPGIDLGTVEYSVTFGGVKDDVGAVIVARSKGFDALTALLRKLPISPAEIETAIRVLTSQPSYAISDVPLTKQLLRSLGL